jgi:hypothetical protein
VYSGVARQLDVRPPRIEAGITVDGVLDEPVWREAAVLTGFSQYAPVDGRPAEDSTEVLVWYSATAIYFGVRAFEPHGAVHASLAERDKIGADDYVQILIDTFNDHRQALVFGVSPAGVQADGTLSEGTQSRVAGLTGNLGAVRDTVDLSADFVYESKGRLTDYGYEVEIRIPFKSIRYQARAEQVWGLNIVRQVQHSGYQDTWTPARRSSASFLAQSGMLSGLTDLRRGLVLDVTPEATERLDGAPAAAVPPGARGWRYDAGRPQLGATVRWGVTNNLTAGGTANPDFSQVEADAGQLSLDPRVALFFPEKRPFFLEGLEYFAAPNQLLYTRRLVRPLGAVKLTGKASGTIVAALVGVDDRSTSATGAAPAYAMLRLRRDLRAQSTTGLVLASKSDGADYNRVAAADARFVFGGIYSVAVQGGASFTRSAAGVTRGPLWEATFDRAGRSFAAHYDVTGIHPDFADQSGFIARAGIATGLADHRLTLYGRPGAGIESWSGDVVLFGRWDYARLMRGLPPTDREFHVNQAVRLRGGWVLGASVFFESFGYDPALYASYALERRTATRTDTVPFVGTPHIRNLDLVFSLATPQFARFDANVLLLPAPQDENFFEWAPARVLIITGTANWRPTDQVRLAASYVEQRYVRKTDGSTVGMRRIPRLKVEYQVSRPVFVRVVGQYDAQFRDALRDDSRSGDPILIRDPATNVYVRAGPRSTNDLRVDWLLAYQPTPGTVLFAGYGRSLSEPDAFRWTTLRGTADGVFLKISYLFRL